MTVSSAAHIPGKIHFDDLQYREKYSKWGAYGQSKLANVLFTYELARRLPKHITANTLHPGLVYTELQRYELLFHLRSLANLHFMRSLSVTDEVTVHSIMDQRQCGGRLFVGLICKGNLAILTGGCSCFGHTARKQQLLQILQSRGRDQNLCFPFLTYGYDVQAFD